jgi:hypothetical protein
MHSAVQGSPEVQRHMRMKVRFAVIPLILVLAAMYLGCSNSEDTGVPANAENVPRLSLATANGTTTLAADGASSVAVQLTVTNAEGEAIADTPVTFSTTAGTLSRPNAALSLQTHTAIPLANGGSTSVAVNTNGDGVAQAILTSSTKAETATVRAEAMGFSVATAIRFVGGPPTTLLLTATPGTVNTGGTSTIEATARDANDNPASGVTITFTLSSNASGASLNASSGITDGSGRASVIYTAGQNAGTDTVRSHASGNLAQTVDIAVQAESTPGGAVLDKLDLLVSSPQLDSDGSEAVTLTALVRDTNNNFVPDVPVTFAANANGGIQVTQPTTDASGKATAQLDTAEDPTNRTITVTASAGGLTSTNSVAVTGTTITVNGANTLVLGKSTTLSILLQDSGGAGIRNATLTVSSARGNTLSQTTLTTGPTGQANIEVTAAIAGSDTIHVMALGASGTFTLTVSADRFRFTTPKAATDVNLGADQTIRVHWDKAGVDQVGKKINFSATRGRLSARSAVTDANGNAEVTISASNAGPAVITAAAVDGPSSQVEILFVATDPTSLILQASPTTLGVNAPGSLDQQSIITAVVRDARGNLVKNQTVSFTLMDVSSGRIFPASAVTDSFGRASTVYAAGATPSAQDGVVIDAEVIDPVPATPCVRNPASEPPEAPVSGPCSRVTLTVAEQALFVILGTSHLLEARSATQYAKPYSVLVTDANSNPISGALVELNIFPTRYQKGFYALAFDEDGNCVGWNKFPTVNDEDRACENEDINRNGVLDAGEDTNSNGTLQPGNVATTDPSRVTTDATGFALFNVVYAKEFTWVEVELEARTTVAGSEASSKAHFFLPGLASDFDDCDISPPGQLSPYGLATTCSCDELTDPGCSTISGPTGPVAIVISRVITPVTAQGGKLELSITGGIPISYTVSVSGVVSAEATLTNASGTTATTVIVRAGETVLLTIPPLATGVLGNTFTVTAVDLTGEQDSLDIVQQ